MHAIVAAFALDERTVAEWQRRAIARQVATLTAAGARWTVWLVGAILGKLRTAEHTPPRPKGLPR
jgi:hypothetical protein